MSPDRDRDLVTARLITSTLRRTGAGAHGNGSASCPGPETLAAFVERRLVPDEVGRLEEHVAGCHRCQEVLARLVRALPVLQPELQAGWSWTRWLSSPWRWALPATAGAVLLAVWVVNRQPVATPPTPESTVAEAQPRVLGIPPQFEGDAALIGQMAKPAPDETAIAASPGAESIRAPAQPAAEPSAGALPEKAEVSVEARDRARSNEAVREKGDRSPAAADAARADAEAVATPSPVTPAPQAGAEPAAARTMRTEPDTARPTESKTTPTAPLPTQRAQETGRRALAPRASEIVSADGTARWRFGFTGMLFKSADGMTWERQETATTLDLLAGAAPSALVCWLVGREGLVLLTTDGERWQRVPFPETIDLVRVDARDAHHAIVTASDGRRFETADGGQTWIRIFL